MVINHDTMCWKHLKRLFPQTFVTWLFFVLRVRPHIDQGEGVWHFREGHTSIAQRKMHSNSEGFNSAPSSAAELGNSLHIRLLIPASHGKLFKLHQWQVLLSDLFKIDIIT